MKKKKYYVVIKGWRCGLYDNWEACSHAVYRYSGVQYKSFTDPSEALAYILDKMDFERRYFIQSDNDTEEYNDYSLFLEDAEKLLTVQK